jgi:hypothetical protein
MMKQTEDTDEKMSVGTWVDLLSGACFISLFHSILLVVNSTRTLSSAPHFSACLL